MHELESTPLASALLRNELLEPYVRAVWERYLHQEVLGEANPFSIRAISRAISAHQHALYGLEVAPHKYKDRVRRAITGENMSAETIDLLAETFDFTADAVARIHKAAAQGFDDSDTVEYLRTTPQVIASCAFLDATLDSADPACFTLRVTLTLLSLESGCSAFLFFLPQGQELTCHTPQVDVRRVNGSSGKWLFTPHTFIPPLTTFSLRFTVSGRGEKTADGRYRLSHPTSYHAYSTGMRLFVGSRLCDVELLAPPATSPEQAGCGLRQAVSDYHTVFYPELQASEPTFLWSESSAI